jgi:DhnA family fructose-bisphosphate aldolase class Ia
MSVQASTPGPKRNQYSNKEFARVNSGFECIGEFLNAAYKEGTGTLAVDVDFSQSVVPPLQLARPLITEALVHRLLHPPRYAFLHRTLSLHWIIDAVGYKNIVFSKADERFVLVQGSEPRKRGKELGVPAVYMEWLRGDDATVSACDLVMCLTPELFVE